MSKYSALLGEFDRGGTPRVPTAALDHDFGACGRVTPVGLLLPPAAELFLYTVVGPVTSDCLVDILETWWAAQGARWPGLRCLVLNIDNGPEVQSGRTQWLARLVAFARQTGLSLRLAYYPPYHSKYNPSARCWGVLERPWAGARLATQETVECGMASMTGKGQRPRVQRITPTYRKGVRLSQPAMAEVAAQIQRHTTLGKWAVDIPARLAA